MNWVNEENSLGFNFDLDDGTYQHNLDVTMDPIRPNAGIARVYKDIKYTRRSGKRKKLSNDTLLTGLIPPNMSRRIQGSKLYAFPTFDKCDSLIFVPIALVKHMNCDDLMKIRQVFQLHAHKHCAVNYKGVAISLEQFIQVQEIIGHMHPDKISCVHDTKVVENTIRATLFTKFTDNQLVYEAIARRHLNDFPVICSAAPRAERWNHKLSCSPSFAVSERDRLLQLAESGVDLVAYGKMEWVMTFNFHTRKIVQFDFSFEMTDLKDGSSPNDLGGLEVVANRQ